MAEDIDSRPFSSGISGSISLLRELQHLLYEIARQSELGGEASFNKIQLRAEHALKLIDSCITSTQVELGQLKLDFIPYGVGSVMHTTAHELRVATENSVSVLSGAHQPVSTSPQILQSLLYSAGHVLSDNKSAILLQSFMARSGNVGVGVFTKDFRMTPGELQISLKMIDRTKMPMAQHNERSGVLLLLADTLARVLGSKLEIKRIGKYAGFSVILPKSTQLSLIEG